MNCLRAIATGLLVSAFAANAQAPARLKAIQLNTADKAVQTRFWTTLLPCAEVPGGANCAGVDVYMTEKAPSAGSAGSAVNHIGFFVPSIEPYFAKVSEAGYKYTLPATGNQIIIDGPDGVRVEITSDPDATAPIRFHHVHFSTPDPKAMQAWYAKVLGAVPGKRAQWDAGDLPNANLTYAQANGAVAPTAGRAIAGVEFEVDDVHRVAMLLRALGLNAGEMAMMTGVHQAISGSFTDPWGTSITLIQTPK